MVARATRTTDTVDAAGDAAVSLVSAALGR